MKKNDHENNENLPFMKTELNGNIDFKYTHTQEYRYEFNFDKYTRLKQTHREKEKMKESIENLFSSPSSSSSSSLLIKRQMANDE